MTRRSKMILGVVVALPLVAIGVALVAVFAVLPRMDLASRAATWLTASLGRDVTIESVQVTPGLTTTVTLHGLRLANIEGGSAPHMATLHSMRAVLDVTPLLRGLVVLRQVEAEGFDLLLERTADRRRNWRFHGDPAGPSAPFAPEPPDRSALPLLLDLRLTRSQVVFRTSSGTPLRTELATVTLAAPAADHPLTLRVEGAYQSVPVTLSGTLGTPNQLRDGTTAFPYPLRATAPETVLTFEGTSRDPLNVDRLEGRLALEARSPGAILTMAGAGTGPAVPVSLAGPFTRQGDLWRLAEATGALAGEALTAPLLELTEGDNGRPDRVATRIDFTRLNLNRILGAPSATPGGDHGDADIPLTIAEAPDPELRAEATAQHFRYAQLDATNLRFVAEAKPRRIAVEALALTAYGGRIEASGELVPAPRGGRITAEASLNDANIDTLRRAFGIRTLPVLGAVQARTTVAAEAATLNQATRQAVIGGVVAMRGGSIAREVIEMASTDIRALFRTAQGQTPMTCLLAVVAVRAGAGEATPLRIRAATGTISGLATFDLNRHSMDLVIGSQSETTSDFALDIPVRVSGSFADPDIAPARWSSEGRARLAAGDRVAPLPASLQAFARENPCFWAGSRR
ncbi:AsmA family protein [Humitalea sp. 24SJ18S-53]|uniref:AsmA family protein n=1 Tax=Humitalea sp. 24SJ18S-53 TaxID=3422307 RepID=UPI003D67883E